MGRRLVELRRPARGPGSRGARARGIKQGAGRRQQAVRRPAGGRRGDAAAAWRGAWAMGKGRHQGLVHPTISMTLLSSQC
uniref:Uncharacterized protein n=1 Tax=Oryza rufipogon TaxID=4529 RepID=A0A0E0QKI7_ORYRU